MGTATTMNSLAEALGMQLPGAAAIPPLTANAARSLRNRQRIVDMVLGGSAPSDIMTREAFENAIVINSAIGGSTNAPIHLNGIARHLGVPLDNDDWQKLGHKFRFWSICNPPESIWARIITAPAACPPSSAS